SSSKQNIPATERKKAVAGVLREAATLAVQLDLPIEQAGELLRKEYENIVTQRANRGKAEEAES
ncbi:MAG: hypothetical protein ACYSW8_27485, partial [Planctomycetota bacterium]